MIDFFDLRKDSLLKVLAILLALSSLAGFMHIGGVYFPVLVIFSLIMIAKTGKNWRPGLKYVGVFLFVCLLSLVINDPPSFFRPWSRFVVYALVILVVSPLFVSLHSGKLRYKFLLYLLDSVVLLSIGSFIAYFFGINLFIHYGRKMEITDIGHFSGIMNHSIALGHFAGLSAVYLLVRTLSNNGVKQVLFAIGSICCYGACLFSASRNGIISCLIASVVVFVGFYRKKLFSGFLVLLLVVSVAASTYTVWGWAMELVVEKNELNVELGENVYYSREKKFDARIAEFKKSPIIGIGYYAIDPDLDKVEFSTGQIEPGSSWLAIASMTGILGFIAFFIICFMSIKKAWKSQNIVASSLLSSLLCFYFIHMISEGYIIAPRSIYGVFFWLIVSSAYFVGDLSKKHSL